MNSKNGLNNGVWSLAHNNLGNALLD